MMNVYMIEALAPLVFRSGKPFGSAGADGGNFPLPSSLAGLVRALHAEQQNEAFSASLQEIASAGPLLASRRLSDAAITPLFQRPADALYLRDADGAVQVQRLSPKALLPGSGCDLPNGLLPVQLENPVDGKPAPGPQFWSFGHMEQWGEGEAVSMTDLKAEGLEQLPTETRTHVGIERTRDAAENGRLFQTAGLDLAPLRHANGLQWNTHDLVFLAQSAASLQTTLANFGGERRMVRVHPQTVGQPCWPALPQNLTSKIVRAGGLKLTIATPALFGQGYLPGWINPETLEGAPPGIPTLRLRLKAAAIERWLPVSGWDLAQHKPRAMRKAVAAGAVYWFECLDTSGPEDLEQLWLAPLSDHPQDRQDGFGLALLSPWQLPAH